MLKFKNKAKEQVESNQSFFEVLAGTVGKKTMLTIFYLYIEKYHLIHEGIGINRGKDGIKEGKGSLSSSSILWHPWKNLPV